MAAPIKICAANFWPGFSLEIGFVRYLFELALGSFAIVSNEREADIVVSSVFPRRARLKKMLGVEWPRYPEKTISFIWENQRPDYQKCRFSISSDFDSYGGRNFRAGRRSRESLRAPSWRTDAQANDEPSGRGLFKL